MTTSNNNKNDDTDNKWIQWIKNGIADEFISYHDYNEFQNIKRIGSGGFGNVYRANWESSNTVVALKTLINGNNDAKEIVNEIKLMKKVDFHANIIQFFGITSNTSIVDPSYLFVLEYADSGTLKNYLKDNFNKLDWNIKLKFAVQIADAVSCIHKKEIIHNDLHSDNILVHQNVIKLADFGLSCRAGVSNSVKDVFGKIPYIDPQRFRKCTSNYDKKSDVYSVGVLLWEISSGQKPFESFDNHDNQLALMYYILDGNREVPIVGTPDDYINIYTRCWQYNPDDRPDMHRVFSDLTKVNINEYTSLAEKNTNTSENFTEQKINNSLNDCSGLMYDQQSSYKIQIMNLTCSNYVSSQEDNEVSNGNDLKIIMTGTVDLKDLDINNNEHFKRINVKPSLENGNYEVFGSIISKDKKENLKSDFFITFGLYDINGFSAMIKTLNIENQKINITECYILWMIIGKPLELSVFSPKNRELQVYYMREYIILQPDKSHYTIRTSRQLSQEDMISVNIYYSTTNCGPMDIKFVGWSKNSISFQIIYNSTVISVDNDNDTDPLISIDIRISILSSKYKKLKIDNEEKEFYLNLIGYLLSNKNFIKESSGEDDPNNTHINKKMSFDNSIISINENYDETSELIMIDTEKNSNLEAIGVVINVAQTFDEFAPLIGTFLALGNEIKRSYDIAKYNKEYVVSF
ncbi:unnamed protein product [Rhizophagus irregularis]|nr:unnamed protein product [Rhizophagus irregularis]